jgi:hypothetical protein
MAFHLNVSGPRHGPQWPATWGGYTAAAGLGAALGGLPSQPLLGLGVASAGLGAFSGWWSWARRRELRQRGTLYVIREVAGSWQDDEKEFQRFLASARRDFPAVREVAGPGRLHHWYWPLTEDRAAWNDRVDEIVAALRILREDRPAESVDTESLVLWCRWPVAVLLGARLGNAQRGGEGLLVRRRPTFGRQDPVSVVSPDEPALDFGRPAGRITALGTEYMTTGTVRLQPGSRPSTAGQDGPLQVRLLRFTSAPWGPVLRVASQDEKPTLDGALRLTNQCPDLTFADGASFELREWRCLPEPGPPELHDWTRFPELVGAAVSRLAGQFTSDDKKPLLLGVVAPQEVTFGLGARLARADQNAWPRNVFALVWDQHTGSFVIPPIHLGRSALHRAETRDPDSGD